VEIALLDRPVLEGDGAVHGRGHAEHAGALDLGLDPLGIGNEAAVDGHVDFRHANIAVLVDPGVDHGRHVADEAAVDGDPQALALGQALANLFSMQDARNLVRYGGMRPDRDVLQFDCAWSYGLVEYIRTLGHPRRRVRGQERALRGDADAH
jgi:hypothetical protein